MNVCKKVNVLEVCRCMNVSESIQARRCPNWSHICRKEGEKKHKRERRVLIYCKHWLQNISHYLTVLTLNLDG